MSTVAATLRARVMAARLNDWQTYHEWVEDRIEPGAAVLEVGCGRGDIEPFPWHRYPDVHRTGLDPDPTAATHPHIGKFVPLKQTAWHVPDESVDLVICRYVLEHVADPEAFFANLHRVLKPGGRFVFLTPNLWHPAVLVSALLPTRFKQYILRRTMKIDDKDVFPTHYRMNTSRRLRSLAGRWDLSVKRLVTHEFEPCKYLDEFSLGFAAFYAYFQCMSLTGLGKFFGASILGEFRKPSLPRSPRGALSRHAASRKTDQTNPIHLLASLAVLSAFARNAFRSHSHLRFFLSAKSTT